MAPFERKYLGERRAAIFRSRFDAGLTYQEISDRAAAGELVPDDPFVIPVGYLGRMCREEEARRRGRFSSPLADKAHHDAVEELRRACIGIADDLLSDLRAISRKSPGKVDPRRLAEAIKAVTLAAAIPAPGEPVPQKPRLHAGPRHKTDDKGRETRTGALMRALRATPGEDGGEDDTDDAANVA